MIDTTKKRWRIIDTDFHEFLVEKNSPKDGKLHLIFVWFAIHNETYVVQFEYDDKKERDNVWDILDEEDCMEVLNEQKAKLN